jgi:hypothetical protein
MFWLAYQQRSVRCAFIIEGGPFQQAFAELAGSGWKLPRRRLSQRPHGKNPR